MTARYKHISSVASKGDNNEELGGTNILTRWRADDFSKTIQSDFKEEMIRRRYETPFMLRRIV
jgi:hypothetical protein